MILKSDKITAGGGVKGEITFWLQIMSELYA